MANPGGRNSSKRPKAAAKEKATSLPKTLEPPAKVARVTRRGRTSQLNIAAVENSSLMVPNSVAPLEETQGNSLAILPSFVTPLQIPTIIDIEAINALLANGDSLAALQQLIAARLNQNTGLCARI